MDIHQLGIDFNNGQKEKLKQPCIVPITIGRIPTISCVSIMLAKSEQDRGHGEDGLCAELSSASPKSLAVRVHGLAMQYFTRLQKPILFKGGMMSESESLKSASSNVFKCDSYRAIRISDHLNRTFDSWIRCKPLAAFKSVARPSQDDGVPNRGTTLCAHFTRQYFAFPTATRASASQLFCGINGAFDRAFTNTMSDQLIAFVFKTFSLDRNVLDS